VVGVLWCQIHTHTHIHGEWPGDFWIYVNDRLLRNASCGGRLAGVVSAMQCGPDCDAEIVMERGRPPNMWNIENCRRETIHRLIADTKSSRNRVHCRHFQIITIGFSETLKFNLCCPFCAFTCAFSALGVFHVLRYINVRYLLTYLLFTLTFSLQ